MASMAQRFDRWRFFLRVQSRSCKLFALLLLSGLTATVQADPAGTLWRLQITDLERKVKVEGTIRLVEEHAKSCMTGRWKRAIVEAKSTQNESLFPLDQPLAYKVENGNLIVGRMELCDRYLLLSGKWAPPAIEGNYDWVSITGIKALGHFTLIRHP